MLNKKIVFSIFLIGIISSSILTSVFSMGPPDLLQRVEAQSKSKSQSQAAAAIKKAYNALVAAGMTGTPGGLLNTGDGFAQFYRGPNGTNAFVIFWKPSTGAHAVIGPIMTTYKSEGWHLGDLGYPTSDEKDLVGVTDGRYNQFEHGIIAMVKGKGAQAFPTVQAAVDKLKQGVVTGPVTGIPTTQTPGPAKAPPLEKYRVNVAFNDITIHNDHEGALSGDGEYALAAYVYGTKVDLTALSTWKGEGLTDAKQGATIPFRPGNIVSVDLDNLTPLTIVTVGWEEDGCGKGLNILPGNITSSLKSKIANESKAQLGAAAGTAIGGPVGGMVGAAVADKAASFVQDALGYTINKVACKVNKDDAIGEITQGYEPPTFGTGAHEDLSSAKDFTLRYTITSQKIG
jgi:hypothetical protein